MTAEQRELDELVKGVLSDTPAKAEKTKVAEAESPADPEKTAEEREELAELDLHEEGEKDEESDGEPAKEQPDTGNKTSDIKESPETQPVSPVVEKKSVKEKPSVPDPDGKLQEYYDVIAWRVSDEVAHVVVWEGAANNEKIKENIDEIMDEFCYLDDTEAGRVAELFSGQLASDEKITEEFLPALKAFASCDWEEIYPVSIYLLAMLIHKKENGLSLAMSALPTYAFNLVFGEAVTKLSENDHWCKSIAQMPKPETLLSPEQFQDFLLQDNAGLKYKEGKINWLFVLAHSPESILKEVASRLSDDMEWSGVFAELSGLFDSKDYYDQSVVERAKTRVIMMWGDATSLDHRKKTLKVMKERLDFKEFEKALEHILSVATYPLETLEGNEDDPCLVVTSPNTQLALKLFQHTMKTLGKIEDVEACVRSLADQGISDLTLAAVLREMARMKIIDEELADDMIYSCSAAGLLQSCAELLRVVPNPRTHPFMEILEQRDQKTCYKALELFTPDLYAPNCSPDDTNALHIAATYGYTSVVKEILARGFHRLLDKPGDPLIHINGIFRQSVRPATIAVQVTHFGTAKALLQAMEPEDARVLCTASSDVPKPEINLHKVMEEISRGRGGRWDERAKEEGEWKEVPVRLEKNEIQERVEFMEAALDTMVDSRHVDLTLLVQDEKGVVSQQFSGGETNAVSDPEQARKKAGRTLFHKIAHSECETLKTHECFATLTNIIWIDYGIVQGMLFSLYLLFMAFLTSSLVLAARSSDPSQYDSSLDWFRLFCEVVTILWVFYDLVLEIYELGRVVYRSLKQHSVCVRRRTLRTSENDGDKKNEDNADGGSDDDSEENDEKDEDEEENEDEEDDGDEEDDDKEDTPKQEAHSTNSCVEVMKDVLFEYFLDWQNMLDDLAIIFVLLIIPFRIADSDNQWVFAALAFMFHGLRIFKYAIMFKSVGEYVAILVLLIKRDVPQFVTVFMVIIFSLGGALYLSLVGYYNDDNMDTENNNETSEIYLLWWTGFRILAEGSALTYYGPGGFNWLGVLIYWLFLFIVVVVLLNILIAQFSKSYEEESERAQINVILTRTEIILKMEQSALTRPCVRYVRKIRARLTKSSFDYQSVERLRGFVGEREEEKPASSEQVEELQTQTTNLGLQLRKQMDDNTGKSTLKVEEMKIEVKTLIRETNEALQKVKEDMEGKFVGLERAVLDTRRYVDDIKELLLSMKEKK